MGYKLLYDLDKLRTGSLLKGESDCYCVVLGFGEKFIDKNTVMLVVPCGKEKPLTFADVSKYFDFIFISAIIDEFKSLNVVKYDYFNEQESKNFLLKYNLLYPERHCIFKLKAKRVTKLKEGKIYQDYLNYFFYTGEFPFYKLENQDLINIETHSVYPYVGKVKNMEFLEVTEEYQKDFLEYYLYS